MQTKINAMKKSNALMRLCVAVCSVIAIMAFVAQMPGVHAETAPQIAIDPALSKVNVGDILTVSVNLTSVPDLMLWQLAFKYNASVIKLVEHWNNDTQTFDKEVWVPEENVFAGHSQVNVELDVGNDTLEPLEYLFFGISLIGGDHVSVSNGVLFKANFTAVAAGGTSIIIATRIEPVHYSSVDWDQKFSLLIDSGFTEYAYTLQNGAVAVGGGNLKPIASFAVVSIVFDNRTQLVLNARPPAGGGSFAQSYKDVATDFNASGSSDPDGKITKYVWDFGDETGAETSEPFITHVYHSAGTKYVVLYVVDNGTTPAHSAPVTYVVMVGLVLQYFDWSPFSYAVLGIVVVALVVYFAREISRSLKRRSALKQKRLLGAKRMAASDTSK